jgi:hypothetical protein
MLLYENTLNGIFGNFGFRHFPAEVHMSVRMHPHIADGICFVTEIRALVEIIT